MLNFQLFPIFLQHETESYGIDYDGPLPNPG